MKKYILALDEGTTSARSILFDASGKAVCTSQKEFSQHYPPPVWVEQDAEEIFDAHCFTMRDCLEKSGIGPGMIAAIGVTNQRETTVVWDKETGRPVCPAIVWQCRRTADEAKKLLDGGYEEMIRSKTGLIPDAYFSATKIKWILDNVPGAREKAEAGKLLFGTVDTWLVWKLTGAKSFVTDPTNASRTMLYNINENRWDEELCRLFGVPQSMLPEVRPSGGEFGYADLMGERIPITAIAGDQQAALFGQKCFGEGDLKCTYGTGCFLLMNTGEKPVKSANRLLTSVGATLAGEKPQYVLEGSVFVGGAVIQWLRDSLGIIKNSAESEEHALRLSDNGGVYLVPAFSGLAAPYWDMAARGTLVGLTRGAGRDHIIRAALESIAFQTGDVIRAMSEDVGKKIGELKVDGGASANGFLMRFQADISALKVIRPCLREATAAGAAYLAGIACGLYPGREALKTFSPECDVFEPEMPDTERERLLSGWNRAVRACRAAE
ncbi:MAG: glycerol kinase GlpK [Clostridia bacterium]|nr:glycerol kinase GlpK [Clostridia bacterium]